MGIGTGTVLAPDSVEFRVEPFRFSIRGLNVISWINYILLK